MITTLLLVGLSRSFLNLPKKKPNLFLLLPRTIVSQFSRQILVLIAFKLIKTIVSLSKKFTFQKFSQLILELYALFKTSKYCLLQENSYEDYERSFKASGFTDLSLKSSLQPRLIEDLSSFFLPIKLPFDVVMIRNIPYIEYEKQKALLFSMKSLIKAGLFYKSQQTLSIFISKRNIERIQSARHLKVVVNIHGGGWVSGSSDMISPPLLDFINSEEGYILVSLDHRLAPQFNLKDMLSDIKTALLWIHQNLNSTLENYFNKKMPSKIELVIMGESAGGHLAVTTCMRNELPFEIKGCVNLYGVLDLIDSFGFSRKYDHGRIRKFIENYVLQTKANESLESQLKTSPLQILQEKEYDVDQIPRIMTVHGTHDILVSISTADKFHDLLKLRRKKKAKKDILVRVKGARHAFVMIDSPITKTFSKGVLLFLKESFTS